jgi:hypothetical protein
MQGFLTFSGIAKPHFRGLGEPPTLELRELGSRVAVLVNLPALLGLCEGSEMRLLVGWMGRKARLVEAQPQVLRLPALPSGRSA